MRPACLNYINISKFGVRLRVRQKNDVGTTQKCMSRLYRLNCIFQLLYENKDLYLVYCSRINLIKSSDTVTVSLYVIMSIRLTAGSITRPIFCHSTHLLNLNSN